MDLSLLELKDVLGDIKNLGNRRIDSLNFKNISIDSRTCVKNDLFIAIKGKNLDGHSFLQEVNHLQVLLQLLWDLKIYLFHTSHK